MDFEETPENTPERGTHEDAPADQPTPLKARPGLQALTWVGGIAAGFATFVSLIILSAPRARGTTPAAHAKWQLWHDGPRVTETIAQDRATQTEVREE